MNGLAHWGIRLRNRWRSGGRVKGITRQGKCYLHVQGEIRGRLHVGHHYGIWTMHPTFIHVGEGALIMVDGDAYFYGDNIVRVENGGKLTLGDGTHINLGTHINAVKEISIGKGCLVSMNVHIRDNDGHRMKGAEFSAPVHIGDNVWIGYGATILKGVTIGNGAVIAAGAVVVKDIPAKTAVAGNPAREIRNDAEWSP